jgi:phage replication O-like protein O
MAEQPKYTRVPNALFEALPELGEVKLKLVLHIIRKTTGWQKECDPISLTQFEQATKKSRPAIIEALKELAADGWIVAAGQGFRGVVCWQLGPRLVNSVNQLSEATSELSLPDPVNSVNQTSPGLVNSVNPQKKESKEKKERVGDARKTRTRPPSEKQEPTPALIREALAETCEVDMDIGTKEQKLQVNTSARDLYEKGMQAGKTPDEIADAIRYVGGYFRKHHWKGKDGSVPRPADIREVWRQAITYRNRHAIPATANGHEPKRTILSAEERRRIIAEEAARNGLEPDRRTL